MAEKTFYLENLSVTEIDDNKWRVYCDGKVYNDKYSEQAYDDRWLRYFVGQDQIADVPTKVKDELLSIFKKIRDNKDELKEAPKEVKDTIKTKIDKENEKYSFEIEKVLKPYLKKGVGRPKGYNGVIVRFWLREVLVSGPNKGKIRVYFELNNNGKYFKSLMDKADYDIFAKTANIKDAKNVEPLDARDKKHMDLARRHGSYIWWDEENMEITDHKIKEINEKGNIVTKGAKKAGKLTKNIKLAASFETLVDCLKDRFPSIKF